jgi:hypothetical protein
MSGVLIVVLFRLGQRATTLEADGGASKNKASCYSPASWARTMASARSATCSLLKILDT